MPACALDFRAKCGSFVSIACSFMAKRAFEKAAMHYRVLTLRCRADGVTLGLVLTLLFWGGLLLQCGDVEQNPGPAPQKTDSMRQTRLTSSGRRASTERTAAASQDTEQATPTPTPTPAPAKVPSMADLMTMMENMTSNMDRQFGELRQDVKTEMREMREQYEALQDEVKGLREEVAVLRQENKDLARTNADLGKKLDDMDRKTDDLECRSRRNNLLFYGIKRGENESNEECESKVKSLLTDTLKIGKSVEFDRVHRLSPKPDSPIIARCCFYKDKTAVLKAKRNLIGTNVFVGEDFSQRVRDVRRRLTPHLKEARSDGKRVSMIFDHLLIDGKKFGFDGNGSFKHLK